MKSGAELKGKIGGGGRGEAPLDGPHDKMGEPAGELEVEGAGPGERLEAMLVHDFERQEDVDRRQRHPDHP